MKNPVKEIIFRIIWVVGSLLALVGTMSIFGAPPLPDATPTAAQVAASILPSTNNPSLRPNPPMVTNIGLNVPVSRTTVSAVNNGTMTVGWTANPIATGYRVHYGPTTNAFNLFDAGVNFQATLSNLNGGAVFWNVTAYSNGNESLPSPLAQYFVPGYLSETWSARESFTNVEQCGFSLYSARAVSNQTVTVSFVAPALQASTDFRQWSTVATRTNPLTTFSEPAMLPWRYYRLANK